MKHRNEETGYLFCLISVDEYILNSENNILLIDLLKAIFVINMNTGSHICISEKYISYSTPTVMKVNVKGGDWCSI